jgi:hypothetical protein
MGTSRVGRRDFLTSTPSANDFGDAVNLACALICLKSLSQSKVGNLPFGWGGC